MTEAYDWADNARGCYKDAIRAMRLEKVRAGECLPLPADAEEIEASPLVKDARQIGECTLYCGDCLEVLPRLPAAHAVITDPPYCSGAATEAGRGASTHQGLRSSTIQSGRFSWFNADNMTTAGLCELLRSMCIRAPLNEDGSILSFCDWRMVTMLSPVMESAGFRLRNILVWDKGHFGCGTGFRPRHELILHLTRRAPEFYSARVGNVIGAGREADRNHPTQKPIPLMSDLIEVVSPKGGLIVDPFAGSGTTLVACARMGRRGIGIEIDKGYFEIACRRIEEAYQQPDMFVEAERPKAEQLGLLDN